MADGGQSRRSNVVTLTVIGMVAAVSIADETIPQGVEMRRNLYANRAACERDYPPSQCGANSGGSTGLTGGGYYGPYYSANPSAASAGDPGSGRTMGSRVSYETSYRGGFGAFGRAIHGVA
jgi:hypothetical protein